MISTLAVMGFDPCSKCMRVESLHPGVTREDVIANTGFELPFARYPRDHRPNPR